MTFKLSPQLDYGGDPNLPFQIYESYVASNRWRFPESCLNVIEHPDWAGGSTSRAPYYSDLVSVDMEGIGSPTGQLKLTLHKHLYVDPPFTMEITYHGLFDLEIPSNSGYNSSLTWRFDQFLFFDAYHSHNLKDKFFTHQIEWVGGKVWSMTAREITVNWINFTDEESILRP